MRIPPFHHPTINRCGAILAFCCVLLQGAAGQEFAAIALSDDPDPFGEPYRTTLNCLGLSASGVVTFYPQAFFGGTATLYRRSAGGPPGGLTGNTRAPNGGTLGGFGDADVNSLGDIAFSGNNEIGTNLYALLGNRLSTVALVGAPAPGDGTFTEDAFQSSALPAISDRRQIAFRAKTSQSGQAIFLATPAGSGVSLTRIAKLGSDSPDGGHFTEFDAPSGITAPASGAPLVAFTAKTNGTSAGGLFLATPTLVSQAASGYIPSFRMNNAGQVVYENGDIYLGSTAGSSPVVRDGDAAPGGGTFLNLREPGINDSGEIVFIAYVNRNSDSSSDGIFVRDAAGTVKTIASSAAPGGGTLSGFGPPEINNAGLVMFTADVEVGDQTFYGIFFGDGKDLVKVVQTGDLLLGTVIASEGIFSGYGPSPASTPRLPGHGSFNIHGQVAFRAKLQTGKSGIFLASQSVHWRTAGAGLWDVAANWTFGLAPAPVLDVAIDPAADAVVTGPAANTVVRSLKIGGGTGSATLALQPTGRVFATKGVTVTSHGILSGTGAIGGKVTLGGGAEVALQLGGRVRGTEYQALTFTGPVAFGGKLNVTTGGAFVPQLGDRFDLLDFGAHSGMFATVSLPPLPSASLAWDRSRLYSAGVVEVALVPALRGAYAGRIVASAVENSGAFSLKMQSNGKFRATGTLGGKAFIFTGAVDAAGAFTSEQIDPAGHVVKLQLDLANPAAGSLAGTVLDSAATPVAAIAAQQTPLYTARVPSPLAGAYTLALPADTAHPEPAFPQGTGFATLTVTATGRARLVGALGDGTPISAGGVISAQGEMALFIPLYRKGGFLSGQLVLRGATATQEVTGTLNWRKPATETPAWYPAAFAGDLAVEGSGFDRPPAHPKILDFPNGGRLIVTGGNVPPISPAGFTIDTAHRNAVVFTPPGPRLAFTGSTFAGAFPATVASQLRTVSFRGVVLQKQNIARGFFKGDGQTGSVKLEAQ